MLYVSSLRAFSKASFLSLLILLSFACDDTPGKDADSQDSSQDGDAAADLRPGNDFPEPENNLADADASSNDNNRPVLLAIRPLAYDGLASRYTSFVAEFNEAIDPASVTDMSFIVAKPNALWDRRQCQWSVFGEENVAGKVSVNRNRITFQPDERFETGRIYCVYFSSLIRDLSGNSVDFSRPRVLGSVGANQDSLLTYFYTSPNDLSRSWDKGIKIPTKLVEHLEVKVLADREGRTQVFSISNDSEGNRQLRFETSADEIDRGRVNGVSDLIRSYQNNFFAAHDIFTFASSRDLSTDPDSNEQRTNLRNLHVAKDRKNYKWVFWQQDVGEVSTVFFRYLIPRINFVENLPISSIWEPVSVLAGGGNESAELYGVANYMEDGIIAYYGRGGQIYSKLLLNDGSMGEEFLVSSYPNQEEWTKFRPKVSKNYYGVSMISWIGIRDNEKRVFYRYHKPSESQMSNLGSFAFPDGDINDHYASIDGLTNAVFALKEHGPGGILQDSYSVNYKLFYKPEGEIESQQVEGNLFSSFTDPVREGEESSQGLMIASTGLRGDFLFAENRSVRNNRSSTLRHLRADLVLSEEHEFLTQIDSVEALVNDFSGNILVVYSKFHLSTDQAVAPQFPSRIRAGGIKSLYSKVFSSRGPRDRAVSIPAKLRDEQLLEIDNASSFSGAVASDFSWDGEGSLAWLQFDGVLPKLFLNRFHNRALYSEFTPTFSGLVDAIDADGRYTRTILTNLTTRPDILRPSVQAEMRNREYRPLSALFASEKTTYLCESFRNNAQLFHLNPCEEGIMGEDVDIIDHRVANVTGGAWLDYENAYMLQTNVSAMGVDERNYVYPAASHFFTGSPSWREPFVTDAPDNNFYRNVKPAMNRFGRIMIMHTELDRLDSRLKAKTLKTNSSDPFSDNLRFDADHEVSFEEGVDRGADVTASYKNEARIFTDIDGSFHLFWVQGRFILYRKYEAIFPHLYEWRPVRVVTEEAADEPIHDMTAQVNIHGDMFVAYTTRGEYSLFYRYKSRNDQNWSDEQSFTPPQRTNVTEIVGDLQSAINDNGSVAISYTSFIGQLCNCVYANAKRQWALVGSLSEPVAKDLVSNHSDFYYNAFEMGNNHARPVVTKDKAHIFFLANLSRAGENSDLYHTQCNLSGEISCTRPQAVDGVDLPVEWPTVGADEYGNVFFAYRTRRSPGGGNLDPDAKPVPGQEVEIAAGDREVHFRKYIKGSGYTPVNKINGGVGDYRIRLSVSKTGHADILYTKRYTLYHQRIAFGLDKIEDPTVLARPVDNPLPLTYFYRDPVTDMLMHFFTKSQTTELDFKTRVLK